MRFSTHSLRATLLAMTALVAVTAHAADQTPQRFDIPADNAAAALNQWAREAGVQVVFPFEAIEGRRTPAVRGIYKRDEALQRLIQGLALEVSSSDTGMVTLRARVQQKSENSRANPMQTAQADASAAGRADERGGRIEELIVTAQRREESVQDIPLSVTAISAEDILRRGLVSQSDYLRTLPGVSQVDVGAGSNSIVMRGVTVSPQTTDVGARATVGYYIDDVPLAGLTLRGGGDIKLIDLQRIEVIRGPQGTLYGSGSLGGTVRNIANVPNLTEVEGYAKAGYSHTAREGGSNGTVEGVINLPLVEDKLALRAVGYWFENTGYVENIAGQNPTALAAATTYGIRDLAINQKHVGGDEYVGGRVSMLWQATDQLSATLMFLKQDITQDGLPDVEYNLPGAGLYQQARTQLHEVLGGGSERLEDNLDVYNGVLQYDSGWGTFLSSTAWAQEDYLERRDIGNSVGGRPVHQNNAGDTSSFVEELRFASEFDGPLQLIAGLFYQKTDRELLSLNYYGGRIPTIVPAFSATAVLPGGALATNDLTDNIIKQKAAFGEVSYEWNKLELTLGGRAFRYSNDTTTTRMPHALNPTTTTAVLAGKNDGVTYKTNLSYKPTDDALLYAQFAEGFRNGATVGAAVAACDQNRDGIIDGTNLSAGVRTLDPDTLESYEVGSKLTLLDGALSLDAAAYRNSWKGIQVSILIPCGTGTQANAGSARTQGLEFASAYSLSRDLRLSFAASYVKAELTSDAPNIQGGLKGDRLPGSPDYTVNLGAEYEFDAFGRESFVRADYAYVGAFYNNVKQTGLKAGDYGLLNLRAGIDLDHVGLDFYINNAMNADERTWVSQSFTGVFARAYRLKPRTIGVNARYTF